MTPTLFQLPTTTAGTVFINANDLSHIRPDPAGAFVVLRTGYAWTTTLTPEAVADLIPHPTTAILDHLDTLAQSLDAIRDEIRTAAGNPAPTP